MNLASISKYPFLLPLCGLSAGILAEQYGAGYISACILSAAALLTLCSGRFSYHSTLTRDLLTTFWILPLFTAVGIFSARVNGPAEYDFENDILPPYAEGTVEERQQGSSETIIVSVSRFISPGKCIRETTGNLRVQLNTDASEVNPGDRIYFIHSFRRIDPEESSYNAYLVRKGILFSQNIDAADMTVIGQSDSPVFVAERLRHSIIVKIEKSDLKADTKAFVTALTLGDSSLLPQDEKERISSSGLAHVFALSGLHIGIISGIILLILFPVKTLARGKILWMAAIFIIWIYIFITGMHPSSVRAGIMMTFLFAARCLERKNSSLNALFAAAFIILLFSPQDLFNVGLQFSFFSVLSLIILLPDPEYSEKKYKIIRRISMPALTCLAATAGSIGLTAYYFNRIPIWFLPLNILVVPLLPIYVTCAILYISLLHTGVDMGIIATILDSGYSLMVKATGDFSNIHAPSLSVWISPVTLICWYLLIGSLAFLIHRPGKSAFSASAVAFCLLCCSYMFIPGDKPSDGFTITGRTDGNIIRIYSGGEEKELELSSRLQTSVTEIYGTKIIVLDHKLPSEKPDKKLRCGLLLVSHGYYGNIEKILSHIESETIVFMPSIYDKREEDLVTEARSLRIPYHSVRASGPLKIPSVTEDSL